jgi:HopA1 effector protein family
MSDYRASIEGALAAVQVASATSYAWFGTQSHALPEQAAALIDPASAREYLLYNLQSQLYADFYCPGRARPQLGVPELGVTLAGSAFVHSLAQANAGKGSREPGWTVVGEDAGRLVVTRDGLSLWMAPEEVYALDGVPIAPGAPVGVLMPKELLRLSPGFYMALGDVALPLDGSLGVLRLYWNVRPEGARALVGALTSRLNERGVPFRAKVASDPAQYGRCDAGVLYAPCEDYERLRELLASTYDELAPLLEPATPALTKRLLPGLGLAEDPVDRQVSFGMSRCRLLAEAIVEAFERGIAEPEQRLGVVGERFARAGIELSAPYLNPGSSDRYRLLDD